MPQLGRFDYHVQSTAGSSAVVSVVSGASVTVYREGATVNGNQSGVTPLAVTVRHAGKIATSDSVFVNTTTGTTYTATRTSATVITLSGFVGTLALTGGDRLTPSNSQPTLYSDDQGGATTANPLTSDSRGRAQCWMNTGAYDFIVSGGGATTTAFVGEVTVGESPAIVYSGELDSASAVAHVEDTVEVLSTAGAKLKSFRNLGSEKASVDKDGTGIFPRLGQSSSGTTGGAIRFVDGNIFPLTVAGVQAALDECETAGGGTVYVPSNANITISTTAVKIPNRVALWGTGSCVPGTPTFICTGSVNASAMIQNKTQDGTQQFAGLRNIQVDGTSKSSGGTITNAAIWFKRIFSSSYIKDCRVTNIPGKGMLIEATTAASQGPFYLENNVVANTNDDCVVINEGCLGVIVNFLEADRPGVGKAAVRVFHTPAAAAQSIGTRIANLYSEISGDITANFVVIDNAANVSIDNAFFAPGGTPLTAPVIIKGTGASKGGPSGFNLRNAYFEDCIANSVLIDDQASSVQVTAGPNVGNAFRFVQWYSSPAAVGTLGNQTQGQIVGIQYQKQGAALTAAATITPMEGSYFVVNGNTGISSITANSCDKGRIIVLKFSGTPTVTDGSNLIMAGNLVATADDTLTMVCDGTNWIEMCRSIN